MRKKIIFFAIFFVLFAGLGIFSLGNDNIAKADTIFVPGTVYFTASLDKQEYAPSEIATYSGYIELGYSSLLCGLGIKTSKSLDLTLTVAGKTAVILDQKVKTCQYHYMSGSMKVETYPDYFHRWNNGNSDIFQNIGGGVETNRYKGDFSFTIGAGTWALPIDYKVVDPNHWPVATAGADKTVNEGQSIVFSDAAVSDPEGDPITGYYWTCLDMTKVRPPGTPLPTRYAWLAEDVVAGFNDPTLLNPTFTAPAVTGNQSYLCFLNVTGTHTIAANPASGSVSKSFQLTSAGVQGNFLVTFTLDKKEYESSGVATYKVDVLLTDNGSCNPKKAVKFYLDVTIGGVKKVLYNYSGLNTCQQYSSTFTATAESMAPASYADISSNADLYFDLSQITIPWWNPIYSYQQHLIIPYGIYKPSKTYTDNYGLNPPQDSMTLTVKDLDLATLRISPQTSQMAVGDKIQYKAYYDDNINDSTPEVEVTNSAEWSSNNSAVVSVGNAGGGTWYENLKNFVQKLSAKLFAAAKNPTPAPLPNPLPAVIKGYAEAKADGQAKITATYNDKEAGLDIVVSSVDPNLPPTVNAGADKNVARGGRIAFSDATASDPENDPMTYAWQCLKSGTPDNTVLDSATVLNPTFIAPFNASGNTYDCILTVTETHTFKGATAYNTGSDNLSVTVYTPQSLPRLRLGPPTSQMYVNQKIQFNSYFDSDITDDGAPGGDPTPETNVTASSNWSSASSTIIAMNNTTTKGSAQGKSVGTTYIMAIYTNPATGLSKQAAMDIEVVQQEIDIKEVAP